MADPRIQRITAVVRRIFTNFRHDKRSLALACVAPLFAMTVFGLAFSGELNDVPVIVVNDDLGAYNSTLNMTVRISSLVVSNLDEKLLSITSESSLGAAVAAVEDGEAWGVIYFPANFTQDIFLRLQGASGAVSTISLRLDNSNVNVASAIQRAVADALLMTMSQRGIAAPVNVDSSQPIYGEGAEFIDYFAPGVMAFAAYLLTTLLTLLAFVGERTTGTLERLLSTPLSVGELVTGYAVAYGTVALLQSVLLLSFAILAFGIEIAGNAALALLVIALLAVVSMNMGMLISTAAKRELQVVQLFPFIVLPVFLLSGIFWPLEAMPGWLRPFAYIIPPTYAVDALRSIMIRGWGLEKVWLDVAALLIFAVALLALNVLALRRIRKR
jgi:ABC-2 type transport system permease protein